MRTKIITPVSVEPITLVALRQHLKLDTVGGVHPDDDLIQSQLSAAREFAEHYTGRALAPQTIEGALDAFPCGAIDLPHPPVTSVTSIQYLDEAGVEQTLAPSAYCFDDYGIAAKIDHAFETPWPATRVMPNAVKVRYVAGYIVMPKAARAALLLIVGHLYENRQEATRLKVEQIPMGARCLLDTIDTGTAI